MSSELVQLRRWNKAICPRTITMLEPLIQVSSNSKSSSPAKRYSMHGRSPRITLQAPKKALTLLILPFKMLLLSSLEKMNGFQAIGNWIVTIKSRDLWGAHLHKVAVITLVVINFYSRRSDLHKIWMKKWEKRSLQVTQCLFKENNNWILSITRPEFAFTLPFMQPPDRFNAFRGFPFNDASLIFFELPRVSCFSVSSSPDFRTFSSLR